MFDVYWTDHKRELVGERAVRKERAERESREAGEAGDKGEKEKDRGKTPRDPSTRHSVAGSNISTGSSSSLSSSERLFGFFTGRSRRRITTPSRLEGAPQDPVSDDRRNRSVSACDLRSGQPRDDHPGTFLDTSDSGSLPARNTAPGAAYCPSSSPRDSVISRWTQPSLTTSSTLANTSPRSSVARSQHLVQTLGPSSFVLKTTQVVVCPRDLESDVDHLVSRVHITSDKSKAATPPLPGLPEEGAPLPFDDFDTSLLLTQFPHTPPLREPQSPYSPRSPTTARGETDDTLGTLEPWRPPNEWECRSPQSAPAWHPAEAVPASPTAVAYGGGGGADHYMSPGLGAVQRELRMMAAASAELTLANLRSEMAGGNEAAAAATGTAVAAVVDAAVYKELEMTKKRWMFSALHRRDGYGAFDCVGLGLDDDGGRSPVVAPLRVLAMYETQASATFLAALHPDLSITHLSPTPLSPALFPNVRPLHAPSAAAASGGPLLPPLPPNHFAAATSLLLPALVPASEMPRVLRAVRRALVPGGALFLTLVDPSPADGCYYDDDDHDGAPFSSNRHHHPSSPGGDGGDHSSSSSSSAGPLLRAWLLEHLLLGLERGGRASPPPSRALPAWLSVAGLRGPGSTIATRRVRAAWCSSSRRRPRRGTRQRRRPRVPFPLDDGRHGGGDEDADADADVAGERGSDGEDEGRGKEEDADEQEERLRSLVLRMLWREVWGRCVCARRWWWDEPDIVRECEERGTYWEYSHIVAVKGGP